MTTANALTAADVLRFAVRIAQIDLVSEALQDHPHEHELSRRIDGAVTAGYLATTAEGLYELTELGRTYLDGPAPITPRRSPASSVPEGHYAVAGNGRQSIEFYRVDRPTEGRWAGRTFVKVIIGGHPDAPVRGREARDVLARIAAAGITRSAQLYGQEIGRCAVCNRHLTDDESRDAGMGPDCRSGSTPRGAAFLAATDFELAN